MSITQRFLAVSIWCFSLLIASCSSAQNRPQEKEATWYDALTEKPRVVAPRKVDVLSIQVSKLARDTFGNGKAPGETSFLSSFVAASGTGIYGVVEFDSPGALKYREDSSSLEKLVDDSDRDLTVNPTDKEINKFFDTNKPLSVKLSLDQKTGIFTLRGYSTPTTGAKSVKASATMTFLSFTQESSKMVETAVLGATDSIEVGPVSFRVAKNSGKSVIPRGFSRWAGDEKADWALLLDARMKPVKQIEILDRAGKVLWKTNGLIFDGKSYTHYMKNLEERPNAVRVTWYEQWELITVPLEIEASLGI